MYHLTKGNSILSFILSVCACACAHTHALIPYKTENSLIAITSGSGCLPHLSAPPTTVLVSPLFILPSLCGCMWGAVLSALALAAGP